MEPRGRLGVSTPMLLSKLGLCGPVEVAYCSRLHTMGPTHKMTQRPLPCISPSSAPSSTSFLPLERELLYREVWGPLRRNGITSQKSCLQGTADQYRQVREDVRPDPESAGSKGHSTKKAKRPLPVSTQELRSGHRLQKPVPLET